MSLKLMKGTHHEDIKWMDWNSRIESSYHRSNSLTCHIYSFKHLLHFPSSMSEEVGSLHEELGGTSAPHPMQHSLQLQQFSPMIMLCASKQANTPTQLPSPMMLLRASMQAPSPTQLLSQMVLPSAPVNAYSSPTQLSFPMALLSAFLQAYLTTQAASISNGIVISIVAK